MRKTVTLILPLILAACSTGYNESFDCAPGLGVGCKSISMVDSLVDQEKLPSQVDESPQNASIQTLEIKDQASPKTVRIWIPDSTDKSGRVIEPQIIHEVVAIGYRPYYRVRPRSLPKLVAA